MAHSVSWFGGGVGEKKLEYMNCSLRADFKGASAQASTDTGVKGACTRTKQRQTLRKTKQSAAALAKQR